MSDTQHQNDSKIHGFVAYSSRPPGLGDVIEAAAKEVSSAHNSVVTVSTWKQIDIPGHFIIEEVLERINEANFVVADITRLNFNVIFEIGYAIGKNKRVLLIMNSSLSPDSKKITELGIFDTIGYRTYENSRDLASFIQDSRELRPLRAIDSVIDTTAPVYLLDTLHKTDTSLRIISKIKKARINFRSYDPREQVRLSPYDALDNVQSSIAVVVHLLSQHSSDWENNNHRGAFLAGLSMGMGKETLIFQEGEEPVPLDYRDFVSVYKYPSDIDGPINQLFPVVMEKLQASLGLSRSIKKNILERLDFGAPAAENEIARLGSYYVLTDEYSKARAGDARIVVGRKGSGKSALFFKIRSEMRTDKRNTVLDLKPDGHQLKRLKDLVLDFLRDSVKEHVATAFWHYLLLLETANQLLNKYSGVWHRDPQLSPAYENLRDVYGDVYSDEVDFSERMLQLVTGIGERFSSKVNVGADGLKYLRTSEVTELVYTHDISKLSSAILKVLDTRHHRGGKLWILFDNIDKGWPTRGVTESDIVILRAILEATRKIERNLSKRNSSCNTVVFIRNDVFELLVDESSDRGKESRISLDWTDRDLFRDFLRRRIVYSAFDDDQDLSFNQVWGEICESHIDGVPTADYLIERSLMRPRNLLTMVNYAKSNAVNMGRGRIEISDIRRGYEMFSADMGNELGLEIRDVFPNAQDILYTFIGQGPNATLGEVRDVLLDSGMFKKEQISSVVGILLWFAFLGVRREKGGVMEPVYIYDVYYDMKKLRIFARNMTSDAVELSIHPAFWPFLDIEEPS